MENIEKNLITAILSNRRADRRWSMIRFGLISLFVLMFGVLLFGNQKDSAGLTDPTKPYVALIKMHGEITADSSFSAQNVIPELTKAFADTKSTGVILDVNSPGGSPVQASMIHDKILELKHQYPNKKVVVFGEDVVASGAYLVATAADKIFVNRDTVTGSIGVIMSSFGFNEALPKLGITRRVFTAGDNKDRLDPFSPMRPQDIAKIHDVLYQVHQNFIQDVRNGRGDRLHGEPQVLFSGDFWGGEQARQLGLVDGVANLWTVLAQEYHVDQYKDYTEQLSFMDLLGKNVGTQLHLAGMELLNMKLS